MRFATEQTFSGSVIKSELVLNDSYFHGLELLLTKVCKISKALYLCFATKRSMLDEINFSSIKKYGFLS